MTMQNIDQLFEQRWQERAKRHRKRQMLFWAPVAAIPVLIVLAFVAGVGKNIARDASVPPRPPSDFFSIAREDSQKLMAHPSPAFASHFPVSTPSFSRKEPVQAFSVQSSAAVDRANQNLKRFQELIKEKPSKPVGVVVPETSLPVAPVSELPVVAAPPAPDPDLARLNELLSKVIAIQHPEQAHLRSVDTSFAVLADTATAVEAITETEGVLTSGETMVLRLESPLFVRGILVPVGTRLYGTVSLENERLCIRVRSLVASGHLLGVFLNVYDMNGQLGIYVPGSLSRDVSKESAQEALGSLALTYDPGLGAQAASAGMQAMKTLLTRKVRVVRVVVRPGYQVYLK